MDARLRDRTRAASAVRELEEQGLRDQGRLQHHNYLHFCAPYNRGCAQELYGN